MSLRTFHYIRKPFLSDAILLGWLVYDDLEGTAHGRWSALCEWRCVCGRKPYAPGARP